MGWAIVVPPPIGVIDEAGNCQPDTTLSSNSFTERGSDDMRSVFRAEVNQAKRNGWNGLRSSPTNRAWTSKFQIETENGNLATNRENWLHD